MTADTTAARRTTEATARIMLASLVGLLAAVLMPLGVPTLLPAASAHDTLISSSPAAGESFEQAPEMLELTYSDEVLNLTPVIRLTTSAGEEIFTATPTVSGNTASIDLPPLPADDYQVLWRVVSSDGHPIEGTVDFTVTVGAETTATADSKSDEEAPAPSTEESSAEATAAEQADAPQSESGLPLGIIFGGLALLLVLAVIGAITVRLRRNSGRGTD
ncbi:copper resistance CopC family protein [Brachybacterium sp. J144]|uniref:copper resistance CopC family protein n=1 Tax=Brachybacterium sp. J144 TaxID=3116487 RepID=UPI002E7938EC|nr:copper resistance CopC family protein [Brachybacterium sp. J144]MEE1649846.1 copper resistance CopC family protein [Brachybacterium sp. J144]